MSESEALRRLRDEVEALRLANAALESQIVAGAEQTDAMLREVESQRNALRDAHVRARDLSIFAQRVMDTVASLVIVLGPDGRVLETNLRCQREIEDRAQGLKGRALDELLHPDERSALVQQLPPRPWPVHSALFETVRLHAGYDAEHRLAVRDGSYRHYLVSAAMLYGYQGKEEGAVVSAADISTLKQQEQRLRASEARLNQAQRISRLGSWELDLVADKLSWSPEVFRIFELDEARFKASYDAFLNAIHPEDRTMVDQAYTSSLMTRQPYDIVHRLLLPDGRVKWVEERCATQYDEEGAPIRSLGTVQDITERYQAEEKIRLAASVFDSSLNGILITAPDGVIIEVNQAFTDITGYCAAEAVGQTPRLLKSGHHEDSFYRDMWATLLSRGKWEGEVWDRGKDGKTIPLWQSVASVRGHNGEITHFIGVFFDLSEQKAAAEHIHRLAHYDALTGLPNRALLLDRCEHVLARSRREKGTFAILFLDLDHFKHINDSLGHPMGDELLGAVAQRLRELLREQDTVARLGGDEFVILLEDIRTRDDVRGVAQAIVAACARPFPVRTHNLSVGATVGISLFPEHGEDVTTLIKHADLALYRAKERGRGCYQFFEASFTEQATQRMLIENDLRQALERNQLSIQYQPQYSLADGHLAGAEALLRWHHPERGLIAPATFIPIAEDNGLIVPIGAWVLAQACRQAKLWRDAGMPLGTMAVNLSGVQIQRGDIATTVARVLEETGLPASCLELEITEIHIMRHAERDQGALDALRALGVSLTIDDFGTGQSSLSYLRHLPVGKLKIDRSFVADVTCNANSAAITRAILGLGRGLHMTIVAEGVETNEQEDFLRKLHCDGVQGFLYSRPVDPEAFSRLFAADEPKNRRWSHEGAEDAKKDAKMRK